MTTPTASPNPQPCQPDMAAALDGVPLPTWLCRADGVILFANAAARLAPAGTVWPHLRAGKVTAADAADAAVLSDLLAWAARCPNGVLAVRMGGVSQPGEARPASPNPPAFPGILRVTAISGNAVLALAWPQAVALLLLEWPHVPLDAPLAIKRIQHRFGLTPSESAVLGDVVKGHKVAEIARQRRIQQATVRCHLRAIFDKTERRRQADLVRLVTCG